MTKIRFLRAALYIWPFALFAQAPQIENVVVEQSYGTAVVRLKISGVPSGQPSFSVLYGTDPQTLIYENKSRSTWPVSMPSTALFQTQPLGALRADTVYYFRPQVISNVTSPATSSYDCLAAAGGVTTTVSGAEAGCDAATGLGWFRTLPLPEEFDSADRFVHPDVSSLPKSPPTPTLPALYVTQGDVTDLANKLAQCAANTNGNGEVQEILLPAGSTYITSLNLPSKNQPGLCIVRTEDMSKLPPDGVRISPSYAPVMATMAVPIVKSGQIDGSGSVNARTATSGWYFLGIRFSTERDFSGERAYTITDVSNDGTIATISPAHNYTVNPYGVVQVWGVEGSWENTKGPNGTYQISGFVGPSQVRLSRPAGLACGSPKCYTRGGKLRIATGVAICGASETDPIRVTTCGEHGLVNNAKIPIVQAVSGVLSVPSGHGITNSAATFVAAIEGSSVAQWNGTWVIQSTTSNSITIKTPPGLNCFSNCGTIRQLDPLHIKGVEGNTATNGSSYFDVLSPTEFELRDKAANGTYVIGGVVAQEPTHWVALVSISPNANRVHFDRCLFQPGGWPVRTSFGLVHTADHSAIINNYFDDIQFFRQIRPITNKRTALPVFSVNQYYIATSVGIDTTAGHTKLIENNFLEAHGVTVYSQESPSSPPFANGVIRRNVFYTDDTKRAGSPASDGLYYPHRHHLEWKRGENFLIDGNRFIGGWIDYNACGPMIMATPRGSDVVRDLKFTNNTISGGTTGFYFIGTDDRSHSLTPIVSRIIFDNNIFTDLDGYRVSNPHDDAVTPAYCGYPLYLHGASETLIISHNLFDRSRGARTQTFAFSNGRGSGLQIRNNILWYTNDENEGPLWKQGYHAASSSGKPNAVGSVRQVFDTLWSHSSFMNNIVIPGVKSTLDGNKFDSFSASDTLSYSDCTGYFEGFPNIYCAGNPLGLSTAKQNAALVKFVDPDKANFRLKSDSPARSGSLWKLDGSLAVSTMVTSSDGKDIGPDHDALERAQGKVDNFRIVNVTSSEALVAYVAPDIQACAVDFAPAAFPAPNITPQRISDGGGDDLNRNVMLTGLSAGTTYHVRVQCAAEQPYASFETKSE